MGCHPYLYKPNGREIAIPSIRVPGKLEHPREGARSH